MLDKQYEVTVTPEVELHGGCSEVPGHRQHGEVGENGLIRAAWESKLENLRHGMELDGKPLKRAVVDVVDHYTEDGKVTILLSSAVSDDPCVADHPSRLMCHYCRRS